MRSSTLFKCGPLPPTSTSCPPDVIHVMGVTRPSPIFAALLLLCFILNANRRTKNGGSQETRLSITKYMCILITRDNQQLRLLCNERKTAVRRTATRRDGAFEESLPTSE